MATNRTQAERGKFLNADTWDKLTSNIEKGFNEFRGNSDNKLIQILAKYQESKLGQAHTKAGKATSDILFKNPYEFGQQMTNDVSDIFGMNNPNYQMRNAPGTGWGNVGKQLGRTLSTGSFIAGTGNPLGAAVYTGISSGAGYLGNRIAGQSHKSAMSNVLPNMLESVPRGFQIAGISSLTNPWIDKAGLAGKGYWGRNLIKSPLNVVQGLAMDQATGMKTTAQSMAIDALFPFAQEGAGIAAKKFKGNLDDYLEYRKTLSPEDLQKGFVNFGAEVGGSTIKKYKPSELKYLEADGGGIEDAVAGLPKGQTSVTKGPIEAVRTPDGLMVLDGRTRSVEAYKKGDVPIDVKILSKDEALKRWGSMFPEGLLDDIIGDGGEVKGGDLLEEARKYKSADEFVKSKINSYHGTNTEFDKFNLENIGKGEGTDAFGNNTNILGDGIYLSDNKQIADVYAQSRVKKDFITGYKDTGILGTPEPVYKEGIDDLVKQNKKVIESYVGGELLDAKTYKVNDELKELISKEIQKDGLSKANADRLTNQAIDFYRNNTKNISGAETGEFMYVLDKTIGVNNKAGLNAVNKYLASKGYSGIKYPSDLKYEGVQGNNYFIFDTNKIKTSKELTDIWNQANKVGGEADEVLFHGTSKVSAESIRKGGFSINEPVHGKQIMGRGVYLTPTKGEASSFGDEILDVSLNPNTKILEINPAQHWKLMTEANKKYPNMDVEDSITKLVKDLGYGGLKMKKAGNKGETYISVFNPDDLKVKSPVANKVGSVEVNPKLVSRTADRQKFKASIVVDGKEAGKMTYSVTDTKGGNQSLFVDYIESNEPGKGIGTDAMRKVIDKYPRVKEIYLEASPEASGFWEKLGATETKIPASDESAKVFYLEPNKLKAPRQPLTANKVVGTGTKILNDVDNAYIDKLEANPLLKMELGERYAELEEIASNMSKYGNTKNIAVRFNRVVRNLNNRIGKGLDLETEKQLSGLLNDVYSFKLRR